MDFLQCSISDLDRQPRLRADTVILNPPFGTRRKGADVDFLRAAFRVRLTRTPCISDTVTTAKSTCRIYYGNKSDLEVEDNAVFTEKG